MLELNKFPLKKGLLVVMTEDFTYAPDHRLTYTEMSKEEVNVLSNRYRFSSIGQTHIGLSIFLVT